MIVFFSPPTHSLNIKTLHTTFDEIFCRFLLIGHHRWVKKERRVKHIKRMCGIFIAWSSDNHFPLECDEIYKGQIRLFDVCVISGSTSLTSLLLISQCSRFSLCYLSFSCVRGWFDTVVFMCLAFSAYRLFSAFFSTHYLRHNNLPNLYVPIEKVILNSLRSQMNDLPTHSTQNHFITLVFSNS